MRVSSGAPVRVVERVRRVLLLPVGTCLGFAIGMAVFPGGRVLSAQTDKPVYVQYEGFMRHSDGTMLVSFAYINMNDTDVVIPAGEKNHFIPAPATRQQPLTFRKGQHRSACVIVLPKDFTGAVRWSVTHGGHVSVTTERGLDARYALADPTAERVSAGVDWQNAPRNVCLTPSGRDIAQKPSVVTIGN